MIFTCTSSSYRVYISPERSYGLTVAFDWKLDRDKCYLCATRTP